MEINLFDDKYLYLTCPDGIEYIWGVYMHLDMSDEDALKPKNKKIVLDTIRNLMNYQILYVHEWYKKPELNSLDLSIDETIMHIDQIWQEGTEFPELYSLMYFSSPKWYVEKTKNLGMTMTTDWKTFVKEKIGNLEKWIEDNRPKN